MGVRDVLFAGVVLAGVGTLGANLVRPPGTIPGRPAPAPPAASADLKGAVAPIDEAIRKSWDEHDLIPTPAASELAVMRRLNLALTGAVPSIEEIRRFESRPAGSRIDAWLEGLLHDRRTADYLAERLARAYVGTEDGPFLLFRRRRFTTWLSDGLLADRPYDAIVRDLIADRGVWTDHPATNFLTVTRSEETERPDPERVAGRIARAFLGVRLDCAQCHDHPFAPWKQADFRGIAAFFGGVHADLRGIRDADGAYRPIDRKTTEPVDVAPGVPFRPELLPADGPPRARLAAWVTHKDNPNLARATANRMWAVLFGRPLVEPIDDLPADDDVPPALARLADDFAAHGYDLHRLIRVIAATEAFRRDSAGPSDGTPPTAEHEAAWAAFPLTRLRPEQVAGAVLQAASLTTLDAGAPWIARLAAFTGRNDFVRRYGDAGEDEFEPRGGTIPQRLLLLNGKLVHEKTKDDLFNASARVAALAPDDRTAVEVAYLGVLTRRPSPEESDHFAAKLAGLEGEERKDAVADLYWTLLNTTEAAWNH